MFSPKKDSSLRFCDDYGKLKTDTICDLHPLRCMDKCIESFRKATVFSTMVANFRYWKIKKPTSVTVTGQHYITPCAVIFYENAIWAKM